MNTAAALAALGVTYLELLSLLNNSQFPPALTDDGQGDMTFDPTAISNFGARMRSAASNGWQVTPDGYASANWSLLASTSPGPFARSPGGIFGGWGAALFD